MLLSRSRTYPRPGETAAHEPDAVPLISVEGLSVEFATERGVVKAVDGVSWSVKPGEVMALVGESGCGKSVSALAIMGLLAKPAARVTGGRILFEGRDLLKLSPKEMQTLRGRDISMIFQEPMTSLNPVLTIGIQIMEPLHIHLGMRAAEARARARELLEMVGVTDAERRLDQYPHQFSGGMRQRVMIAIGLACNPKLIIADEPTTALDVTIQAQILELMKDLSARLGITLVIITHNLGIVARYADRVAVMYAGRVVEDGEAGSIFEAPRHPYTSGLLRSVPRLDRVRGRKLETIEGLPPNLLAPPTGCRFAARCPYRAEICDTDPQLMATDREQRSACHRWELVKPRAVAASVAEAPVAAVAGTDDILVVSDLKKHFPVSAGGFGKADRTVIRAVDGVSFRVPRGRTVGLVGESGCGKTTVGRMILRLEEATEGEISFEGEDLVTASATQLKHLRTRMQVVFQDPYSSLNPRMTIGQIVAEPMVKRHAVPVRAAMQEVGELLVKVGLREDMAARYPHQLSGGQRQRVGIARALAMKPSFLVCDEPVSALDVSVQAQVINLLDDLQQQLGLTYLFIAHDLAVVRHISHRIVVMYLGRIMEMADRNDLYARPLHPYTQALLDAAPVPDPAVERSRAPRMLKGELPSPLNPLPGCVFQTRCPMASSECRKIVPPLREFRPGHFAACIKL